MAKSKPTTVSSSTRPARPMDAEALDEDGAPPMEALSLQSPGNLTGNPTTIVGELVNESSDSINSNQSSVPPLVPQQPAPPSLNIQVG